MRLSLRYGAVEEGLAMAEIVSVEVAERRETRRNGASPDRVLVSGKALAMHLACSRQRVAELTAEGVFEREAGGLYDQDRCRLRMLAQLRAALKRSPASLAAAKVSELKATKLEYEIAKYRGEHMQTAEALEIVERLVGLFRSHLGSMPATIAGRDVGLRRRIERAADDILEAIASTADAWAQAKRPA
jgi:hypothetical protein